MERLSRSLKTEWQPSLVYETVVVAREYFDGNFLEYRDGR